MNDKIKEYKEKINWNVWLDITSMNNYVIPEKDIRENADDLGKHGISWEMRILSEKV